MYFFKIKKFPYIRFMVWLFVAGFFFVRLEAFTGQVHKVHPPKKGVHLNEAMFSFKVKLHEVSEEVLTLEFGAGSAVKQQKVKFHYFVIEEVLKEASQSSRGYRRVDQPKVAAFEWSALPPSPTQKRLSPGMIIRVFDEDAVIRTSKETDPAMASKHHIEQDETPLKGALKAIPPGKSAFFHSRGFDVGIGAFKGLVGLGLGSIQK